MGERDLEEWARSSFDDLLHGALASMMLRLRGPATLTSSHGMPLANDRLRLRRDHGSRGL